MEGWTPLIRRTRSSTFRHRILDPTAQGFAAKRSTVADTPDADAGISTTAAGQHTDGATAAMGRGDATRRRREKEKLVGALLEVKFEAISIEEQRQRHALSSETLALRESEFVTAQAALEAAIAAERHTQQQVGEILFSTFMTLCFTKT